MLKRIYRWLDSEPEGISTTIICLLTVAVLVTLAAVVRG